MILAEIKDEDPSKNEIGLFRLSNDSRELINKKINRSISYPNITSVMLKLLSDDRNFQSCADLSLILEPNQDLKRILIIMGNETDSSVIKNRTNSLRSPMSKYRNIYWFLNVFAPSIILMKEGMGRRTEYLEELATTPNERHRDHEWVSILPIAKANGRILKLARDYVKTYGIK